MLDQVEINSNRNNDFNFVAAADSCCDTKAHETVTNMQNKSSELVLALRDLSYQKVSNKTRWCLEIMGTILRTVRFGFLDVSIAGDGRRMKGTFYKK